MAAVAAGDTERVSALLAEDPSLAIGPRRRRRVGGAAGALPLRPADDGRAPRRRPRARCVRGGRPRAGSTASASGARRRPEACRGVSPDGFTALHLAAFFGKPEVARMLLDAGRASTPTRPTTFANQPLHAAAAGRHIEVCRLLVAAGRRRERHPARRLHAAPRGGPARRRRDGRAVPVGRCRPDDRRGRRWHAGRPGRGRRPSATSPAGCARSRASREPGLSAATR